METFEVLVLFSKDSRYATPLYDINTTPISKITE